MSCRNSSFVLQKWTFHIDFQVKNWAFWVNIFEKTAYIVKRLFTFEFDFSSWKLTFWIDFLVRKSTFDFWLSVFTFHFEDRLLKSTFDFAFWLSAAVTNKLIGIWSVKNSPFGVDCSLEVFVSFSLLPCVALHGRLLCVPLSRVCLASPWSAK